jgi:hypothetical protein
MALAVSKRVRIIGAPGLGRDDGHHDGEANRPVLPMALGNGTLAPRVQLE